MSQYYSDTPDLARIYQELGRNMQTPPDQLAAYKIRQAFEQPQAEVATVTVPPVAEVPKAEAPEEAVAETVPVPRIKPPVSALEKKQAQDIMTPVQSPMAEQIQEASNRLKASISDPFVALRQSANDIRRVGKSMVAAQDAIGKANQAEAEEKARLIREQNTEIKRQYADDANTETQRKFAVEQSEGKIRQLVDDVRSFKIDPDRLMNAGSNRVVSAIAMALGEMGGAFTGRGNAAMQIIENKIDRDIAAQRDELANKRDSVDSEMNLLGMMNQRFGNDRQGEAATRLAMREFLTMELEANAAQQDSARAQDNAKLLSGQIELQNAKDRASITQIELDAVQRQQAMEAEAALKREQIAAARAKEEADKIKPLPPGIQEDVSTKLAALDDIDDLEKRFNTLKDDNAGNAGNSDVISARFAKTVGIGAEDSPAVAYDLYREQVLQTFNKAQAGPGTVTQEERDMFGKLVPSSTTRKTTAKVSFEGARSSIVGKLKAALDAAEANGQDTSALRAILAKKMARSDANNARGSASKKEERQGTW